MVFSSDWTWQLFGGNRALFFHLSNKAWDLAYLCVALALSIIFLLRQTAGISRRIMESEYCYMELEPDSLAVCQPEKNGRYESCRIFYQEIDKIVEGSRRGIPEFYVVLKETDQERESFFLLDDEEQKRNIFCVRSFGFDHEDFIHFTEVPVECPWQGADHWNQKPGGLEPSKAKYGYMSDGSPFSWLCGSQTSGSDEAVLRRNYK